MTILSNEQLLAHFPELASLAPDKLTSVVLNANIYVLGQVNLPDPVSDELRLATAMVAKDMAQEKRVTSVKQGDYQESISYTTNDPKVQDILLKYSKKRGQKLWMI